MIQPVEFGGKEVAKRWVVYAIDMSYRANERLISSLTGLPVDIVETLLNELEREDAVYYEKLGSLRLWRAL